MAESSTETISSNSNTINNKEQEMNIEWGDVDVQDIYNGLSEAYDEEIENICMEISQEPNDASKEYNELVEKYYQLPKQLTSNEHLKNGIYKISDVKFLTPLAAELDNRTDGRYTELKDCFGKDLILIVYGYLPSVIELEMALVSTYSGKDYYCSLFKLSDKDTKTYKNIIRREVNVVDCGNGKYAIVLDQLFAQKQLNPKKEKGKPFKLIRYPPSINENSKYILVKAKNTLALVRSHNLTQPQLSIRFFLNHSLEPMKINDISSNQLILSNILKGVDCLNKSFDKRFYTYYEALTSGWFFWWNESRQCTRPSAIQAPPVLCHTNKSRSEEPEAEFRHLNIYIVHVMERLTIKLNTRPALSPIIPENKTINFDPCAYNLNSFTKATSLHSFTLQWEMIHETINDHSATPCYSDVPPWNSMEFTEDLINSSSIQQLPIPEEEIVDIIQQNSSDKCLDEERYYSSGLPVTRVANYNHHE